MKDLEFYQAIKLVNYIRSEVKNGNINPDLSSVANFQDEKYLKPVLEDDALLFTLDDVLLHLKEQESTSRNLLDTISPEDRIARLENELSQVKAQYKSYRQTVEEVVDARWNAAHEALSSDDKNYKQSALSNEQPISEEDYFKSYGDYGKLTPLMLILELIAMQIFIV